VALQSICHCERLALLLFLTVSPDYSGQADQGIARTPIHYLFASFQTVYFTPSLLANAKP